MFPLHPNTFHRLFYTHTLPSIEKFKFQICCFTSNISLTVSDQIECLRQFQSIIKQFGSFIDSDILTLNQNIDYISKFNSFVTNCVKSYLCNYVKCISNHYNSCHKSLKENLKTFDCIKKCVESMLSQVKGNRGSEGYVRHVFSNVLDSKASNAVSYIKNNYPSKIIGKINIYLNALANSQDGSNNVDTTTWQLGGIKDYLSEFSGYIGHYRRLQWFIIPSLDRLTKIEDTISKINKNGNGIKGKYDNIKPKIEYCKSYLQFENQRLESISKNAKMLQKQLEILIDMLNKYKTIEDKLKEFIKKLNRMKQNKKKSMDHISRTVQMVICNLYDIRHISTSLNSAKDKVSITTIKQDVENINSSIKDINNILSIVKSHIDSLVGVKLGIDCNLVNEFECCINEIVCGIHKKYCCLSSTLTHINTDEQCTGLTLGQGCQLSGKLECGCNSQSTDQPCATCQDCQGPQDCPSCECIKQLSKSCPVSNTEENLESIKKVVCRLIDGKPVQADSKCTTQNQECPHSCQNREGTQITSSCETSSQPSGSTSSISCQETNIAELIKSTLEVINKCQKTLVKCEGKDQQSICPSDALTTSVCQIATGGPQSTTTCPTTTTQGAVSCNELDKVKFWLDTMINKCNCCQFEKMLEELVKNKKIKSCVEMFKWIFIYNFRELFCLYSCFDKSILNEISCLTHKLQYIKSFKEYLSTIESIIKCRIDDIKSEINEIPNQVKSLQNTMKSGIRELECAIEGVARNFILCTLQSHSNSMVRVINSSSSNIGVTSLGVNQLVGMYSMSRVIDYKVVINRLHDSAKKIDQMLRINNCPDVCKCILGLELTKKIQLQINFKKIIEQITSDGKGGSDLKMDGIKNLHNGDIKENHFCLCMIIKYILYPKIVNISHRILGIDLDTLSTLSMKFDKYHNSSSIVPKMLLIMVEILDTISQWIIKNYPYAWTGYMLRVEIECYCTYNEDRNYQKIVGILLVISSMIENVWTMDPQSTRMAIQTLSSLITEFDKIDSQNNKPICNSGIHMLYVYKECKKEVRPVDKCCCCWCVTGFNLLMTFVSFCIQCKICNALCNKKDEVCKKVENFFEIDKCECQCSVPNQGVCCVLQSAFYIYLTNAKGEDCKTLKELLGECSTQCRVNGCCAKLKEKLKKGLCKLILLGCECNCTGAGPTGNQVKACCVFFNNPWGSSSVAVLVFCKCAQPAAKPCCCLYQLIDKLKEPVKKICEEECKCEDFKKIPEEICGKECGSDCPCTTLKGKLAEICKPSGSKCGASECLCQLIKKCFENLCTKKEKCECKNKGCCKILGASVKILSRACRANVLEPYKRIVTDLVASDKNRPEIIRKIVNGINQTRLNNIYLLKNSYGSHGTGLDNLATDVTSARNWGYDTLHEHQVTRHNSISGDGYPNLSHSNRTGNRGGNKMFKLVLSRLLVATIVVFIFLYLRISYQQFLRAENISANNNVIEINLGNCIILKDITQIG